MSIHIVDASSEEQPSQIAVPYQLDNLGPVGKHDVLIIRYRDSLTQHQQRNYYDSIRQFFRDRGIYPKIIGVIGHDVKIEALSEEAMAQYGWVKR